jgi:hypothetical protein
MNAMSNKNTETKIEQQEWWEKEIFLFFTSEGLDELKRSSPEEPDLSLSSGVALGGGSIGAEQKLLAMPGDRLYKEMQYNPHLGLQNQSLLHQAFWVNPLRLDLRLALLLVRVKVYGLSAWWGALQALQKLLQKDYVGIPVRKRARQRLWKWWSEAHRIQLLLEQSEVLSLEESLDAEKRLAGVASQEEGELYAIAKEGFTKNWRSFCEAFAVWSEEEYLSCGALDKWAQQLDAEWQEWLKKKDKEKEENAKEILINQKNDPGNEAQKDLHYSENMDRTSVGEFRGSLCAPHPEEYQQIFAEKINGDSNVDEKEDDLVEQILDRHFRALSLALYERSPERSCRLLVSRLLRLPAEGQGSWAQEHWSAFSAELSARVSQSNGPNFQRCEWLKEAWENKRWPELLQSSLRALWEEGMLYWVDLWCYFFDAWRALYPESAKRSEFLWQQWKTVYAPLAKLSFSNGVFCLAAHWRESFLKVSDPVLSSMNALGDEEVFQQSEIPKTSKSTDLFSFADFSIGEDEEQRETMSSEKELYQELIDTWEQNPYPPYKRLVWMQNILFLLRKLFVQSAVCGTEPKEGTSTRIYARLAAEWLHYMQCYLEEKKTLQHSFPQLYSWWLSSEESFYQQQQFFTEGEVKSSQWLVNDFPAYLQHLQNKGEA